MKQINLTYIFLCLFACTINAQISTEELPYSWEENGNEITEQSLPVVILPSLDMNAINQEDEANNNSGSPVRFGFPHTVNINLSNSGVWETTSDGGRLWRLEIISPDALSINLLYNQFWLPNGAKLFIYSSDKSQHIGAFTSLNNKGNKENPLGFATGLLFANSIVLEYYEPVNVSNEGIISISKIISGYRYIYSVVEGENQLNHNYTGYSCHNDINCPEGNNWQQEKNAVAYMVMGGYICTGSLLNTTANDSRLVFLSANHCFNTSASTDQWIFYWNYEAPTCGGTANPIQNKSTIGANLLARREDSDFMLLNLIENPGMNPNITVYYLGWNRTTTPATSGVGIHHPKGAQKKISIENNTIINHTGTISWTGGTASPANTHWRVGFDDGTLEGGSSGSPFLNQNKQVIGQLHGGTSGCPPEVVKYYGRFDKSWEGSSSSVRLKDWLDPLNTNATSINGKEYCTSIFINNYTSLLQTLKLLGANILNISDCNIEISNTIVPTNFTLSTTAQESITLKPGFQAVSGSNFMAKIVGSAQNAPAYARNKIATTEDLAFVQQYLAENPTEQEKAIKVFPNPTTGKVYVLANNEKVTRIEVKSIQGVTVLSSENLPQNEILLDISAQAAGMYLILVQTENGVKTFKVVKN